MEELEEVHVVWLGAEVLLEEEVDRALEHERVVDHDVAHALDAVPARLAAARYRLVHHVVRHEEERLQLCARSSVNRHLVREGETRARAPEERQGEERKRRETPQGK